MEKVGWSASRLRLRKKTSLISDVKKKEGKAKENMNKKL